MRDKIETFAAVTLAAAVVLSPTVLTVYTVISFINFISIL